MTTNQGGGQPEGMTTYCVSGDHFYCQEGDVGNRPYLMCTCQCHREKGGQPEEQRPCPHYMDMLSWSDGREIACQCGAVSRLNWLTDTPQPAGASGEKWRYEPVSGKFICGSPPYFLDGPQALLTYLNALEAKAMLQHLDCITEESYNDLTDRLRTAEAALAELEE